MEPIFTDEQLNTIHSGSAAPNWTISKGGRIGSAAALVKGAAGRISNK